MGAQLGHHGRLARYRQDAGHALPDQVVTQAEYRGRRRAALLLVGVEQLGGRAGQHVGQLPPEVVRVLDSRVHALRACRCVHVRRVTSDEDPALPVALGQADVGPPCRAPPHGPHTHFLAVVQVVDDALQDLAGQRLADPVRRVHLHLEQRGSGQRAQRQHRVRPVDPLVPVVAVEAFDLDIGDDPPRAVVGRTGETDPRPLAHRARRTVAADQVLRGDLAAVGQDRRDAVPVLAEAAQPGP